MRRLCRSAALAARTSAVKTCVTDPARTGWSRVPRANVSFKSVKHRRRQRVVGGGGPGRCAPCLDEAQRKRIVSGVSGSPGGSARAAVSRVAARAPSRTLTPLRRRADPRRGATSHALQFTKDSDEDCVDNSELARATPRSSWTRRGLAPCGALGCAAAIALRRAGDHRRRARHQNARASASPEQVGAWGTPWPTPSTGARARHDVLPDRPFATCGRPQSVALCATTTPPSMFSSCSYHPEQLLDKVHRQGQGDGARARVAAAAPNDIITRARGAASQLTSTSFEPATGRGPPGRRPAREECEPRTLWRFQSTSSSWARRAG